MSAFSRAEEQMRGGSVHGTEAVGFLVRETPSTP